MPLAVIIEGNVKLSKLKQEVTVKEVKTMNRKLKGSYHALFTREYTSYLA